MNYQEAVAYILGVPKFAKKTTKENLLELLKRLGNPHKMGKVVHAAGTNGKGSVCAFIESVLREDGKTTGLFTSPHLVSINERIRINGQIISDDEFLQAFIKVKECLDEMVLEGRPHVSFFELLFVMAAVVFAEHKVSYVIYETGMGGRLDATNVLEPDICVITSIGLDHMEYLGDTIVQIAWEKAGIIKSGVPVVYEGSNPLVCTVMEEKAREVMAKTLPIYEETYKILEKNYKYIDFYFDCGYDKSVVLRLNSIAKYQVQNAALAVAALYELLPFLDHAVLQRGIAGTLWQGRMEELEPHIYVDGAHNDAGIQAFLDTAKEFDPAVPKFLLFAVVNDKDYKGMIAKICKSLAFEKIIITKIQGERGTAMQTVADSFHAYTDAAIIKIDNIEDAYACAKEELDENGYIFCVGSLYLVGSLLAIATTQNRRR